MLERAKARGDELGPYTEQEKEGVVNTIQLYEADNEDFWEIMKKDYATQQYQSFCDASRLPQKQPIQTQWAILDEIRKDWIGFYEAMLEHDKTFEKYDFSTPPSVPVSAQPGYSTTPAMVSKKPPKALWRAASTIRQSEPDLRMRCRNGSERALSADVNGRCLVNLFTCLSS